MDPIKLPNPQQLRNERSEEFASAYANNVGFESSVWDLKLIFGQLDQATGIIEQHTAITVPWSLVKLSLYHLAAQITAYEIIYGKVALSPDVLPPEPVPPPEEYKENAAFQRVYEALKRLHEDFIRKVQ